jgi:serine/threonine protein phosphatase PrpC
MRVITKEAQGKRPYMEDRSCNVEIGKQTHVIGIFDGHGGGDVADICKDNFPQVIRQGLSHKHDIGEVLKHSFYIVDDIVGQYKIPYIGSTAVIALVMPSSVWFANAGDSMAMVVYVSGESELMSYEHKVENEKGRIQSEGGRITYDDGCARIERTLNVSRSLGDYHMKKHVICQPFIRSISRAFNKIKYVLMASDGVWDVFNKDTLAQVMAANTSVEIALDHIVALSCNRGSDNVTVTYIDWQGPS